MEREVTSRVDFFVSQKHRIFGDVFGNTKAASLQRGRTWCK